MVAIDLQKNRETLSMSSLFSSWRK